MSEREVVVIDDGKVVHEIILSAPPSEVFEMFVDPQKLIRWIGISADVEPHAGGRFRFEVVPGQYCDGRYEVVEHPRRLVLKWGWSDPAMAVPPGSSTVEVDLATEGANGESTRLRLVHRDLPDDDRQRLLHDDGWTQFLSRLTAVVADEEPPAYPSDQPYERLAQLRRKRV
jgi:uncharacterized protein YndB with AHSA1/START domain